MGTPIPRNGVQLAKLRRTNKQTSVQQFVYDSWAQLTPTIESPSNVPLHCAESIQPDDVTTTTTTAATSRTGSATVSTTTTATTTTTTATAATAATATTH